MFAFDIQTKGDITAHYESINYKHSMVDDTISRYISTNLELKTDIYDYKLLSAIIGLYDTDEENRTYLKFNELYIEKEYDTLAWRVGRDIKFWGALELHNPSDIYNRKNTDLDRFDKDQKLGSDGMSATCFFDNDTDISAIVSTYENNITKYLKYSGSVDIQDGVDFGFVAKADDINTKYINYTTLVSSANIYKLEYSKTDTKKNNTHEMGAGFERTFYNIVAKADLVTIVEYYNSNIKYQNMFVYQNDIFVGVKYNINDTSSSDILAGVIKDIDENSYTYSLETSTKFFDIINTKLSYIQNDFFQQCHIYLSYYF
jgi:hypothetical protein